MAGWSKAGYFALSASAVMAAVSCDQHTTPATQTEKVAPQAEGAAVSASLPVVDIADILDNRVNVAGRVVGMAAGVVTPESEAVFVEGVRISTAPDEITDDTIFEIGSLTKVFTSVLLTDMAANEEAAFDDPISDYLPETALPPNGLGDEITLLHLATHTAGFPRNPPNAEKAENGIFANYDEADLFEYLRSYQAERRPGEAYAYSNIGAGLLGYILAKRAGVSYEELLQERIFRPLGMNDTHLVTPAALEGRMASPHNAGLEPSSRWDFDVLAGAGAIRSSVPDMLRFAAAAAGISNDAPIAASIKASYQEIHAIPGGDKEYYPGWVSPTITENGDEIFWHDGGTGGSRAFLGIVNNEDRRIGVVVVANTAFSVNDIGLHVIDPSRPLRELQRIKEISVAADALDKYAGEYQLGDNSVMTITVEDGQLYAQVTGEGAYPIFPYKENGFFYKIADAQIIFTLNDEGKAVSLSLIVENHEMPAAPRI